MIQEKPISHTRNGSQTKKLILDSALNLFSEKGYNSTSIRQIVKEVGIRESSLYNHFSSKAEILETLLNNYGLGLIKRKLDKGFLKDALNNPKIFLKQIAEEFIKKMEDPTERKFYRILIMEVFIVKKAREMYLKNIIEGARQILTNYLKQMIEKKIIKPVDPLQFINEFLGPLVAVQTEYLLLEENTNESNRLYELANKHVEHFWNLIKK